MPNSTLSNSTATYSTQEPRSNRATMSSEARRPGLEGVPIIGEDVELNDLSESQLNDYVHQAKEAYSNYFPEGLKPFAKTDRSMILLAKNVSDEVFERRFIPIHARYLLDENLDLYIRKVAGSCHGAVHARAIADCGIWIDREGLSRSFFVSSAPNHGYAGKKLEPDVAILDWSDGANTAPRCIIEIEVNHRSPREARELAAVYFRDPNVAAVVLLKVWRRRQNGLFAAACIVWVRPGGDEGVHFICVEAHDFGTAPMSARAINDFQNEDPEVPIPFVPATMAYTLPETRLPIADRVAQIVEIPAMPLILKATNERRGPLDGVVPVIENLRLDLSFYMELINRTLPAHEEEGVDDDE